MPMNTISGRVFLRGTSAGIPGVIVVVQNRSGRPVPAETEAAADRVGVGDRLGSVITDATGSFTLSFEDDEFRVRDPDERRPDLQLSVLVELLVVELDAHVHVLQRCELSFVGDDSLRATDGGSPPLPAWTACRSPPWLRSPGLRVGAPR